MADLWHMYGAFALVVALLVFLALAAVAYLLHGPPSWSATSPASSRSSATS